MKSTASAIYAFFFIASCGAQIDHKTHETLEGYTGEPALVGEWREACHISGTLPCYILADIYERGNEAPRSIPLSIKYYQIACDQGLYYACEDVKRLQSTN